MATKTNTKVTSDIMTMKDALAWAHDTMRNTHAITEREATEQLGVPLQSFNNWKGYVEDLRTTCAAYLPLAEDPNADPKEIDEVFGAIYAAWRAVCKAGAEEQFNKNFFVRENDAKTIAEWCNRCATLTARGRVFTQKNATDFRKHIETFVGIRMTGNAVLNDAERDLISAYEGAVRTITNNEKLLKDQVVSGKTINGLRSNLNKAEAELEEEKEFLTSHNIDETTKEQRLEKYRAKVTEITKAINRAETAIKKATEIRDAKKSDYDKTIALIKSVGGEG